MLGNDKNNKPMERQKLLWIALESNSQHAKNEDYAEKGQISWKLKKSSQKEVNLSYWLIWVR